MPIGHGVVLFVAPDHALFAKQTPPLAGEFGAPLIVTDFRGKLERATGVPEPQPIPVMAAVIPRARDQLRAGIRQKQGLSAEQITRLVNAVAQLCLDDVYTFVQAPLKFEAWIEKQKG